MNELTGLRAYLASPTYGPVDPQCQKSLRVAMMTASNHGLRWAGDISTDKVNFSGARNTSAQNLFENQSEADGIMWVDSDIIVPPDGIWRLLDITMAEKAEFSSGVYHKKGAPYEPVFYKWDEGIGKYLVVCEYSVGSWFKVGACGFGFCWTSTKTIKAIAAMEDFCPGKGGWFPDTRDHPLGMGEDFNFCDKARRAGIQLYVDTGVQLGHMGGGMIYDRAFYLRHLEAIGGQLPAPEPPKWGLVE